MLDRAKAWWMRRIDREPDVTIGADVAQHWPVTGRERDFADAMRVNRRSRELVMRPVDWRPDRMPARAVVELKWDGIHLGYSRDGGAFTREGVDFLAASHLVPGLAAVDRQLGGGHALFGEYVHPAGFERALADFQSGMGSGLVMLFDAVPLEAYEGRCASAPLLERRFRLGAAIDASHAPDAPVMLSRAELFEGGARDNIEVAAGEVWAAGLEGLVVKDGDSPYVRAASPFWQRLKRRETADVRVVGVNLRERDGRPWLRSLTVQAGPGVTSDVGVGFSDAQRADPDLFRPGMVVELRHLGRTGSGALRSPAFLRIRSDKES